MTDPVDLLQEEIDYLKDTLEEIEKMSRTGKASCEKSNKEVLEDIQDISAEVLEDGK